MKTFIAFLIIMLLCTSCFQSYYMVAAHEEWDYVELARFRQRGKVFVIHCLNDTYKMREPEFIPYTIKGKLTGYHSLAYNNNSTPYADVETTDKALQYRKTHKRQVLSEVHIYVNQLANTDDTLSITKSNFIRFREYIPAESETTMNHAVSHFGVSMLGVAVVSLGVLFVAALSF